MISLLRGFKKFQTLTYAGTAFLFGICFFSCTNRNSRNVDPDKEQLMEINKAMINAEQEQIASYIERYGYKMQSTKTGLHYMITKEGRGRSPGLKSRVRFNYVINLLNGDYVYSSDSSGVMEIVIGQSMEPTGLQEALTFMKEGGKAVIIVPSYLAYGITGDGNKIGQSQSLVYKIELLKVD